MLLALTRPLSPSITRCELTYVERCPIDFAAAVRQHEGYQASLETLGCRVQQLPAEPDLPDAVFVEDTAVVLDECAVMARPGAASRRAECRSVAAALRPYRPLHRIEPPGTLDGGDVLHVGRRIYAGLSSRTNAEGVRQLRAILTPMGYTVEGVSIRRCLHLKAAATALGDRILLDPRLIDGVVFGGLAWLEVDPDETPAANVLCIGRSVLCAASAPRTRARLEAEGYNVVSVEASELAKAEGGLTCCSLVFDVGAGQR